MVQAENTYVPILALFAEITSSQCSNEYCRMLLYTKDGLGASGEKTLIPMMGTPPPTPGSLVLIPGPPGCSWA